MFTGIIEEMGTILEVAKGAHSAVLTIAAQKVLEDVHIGDSIAVNGVCLTVTSFDGETFTADVMHETLNRSSLAQCKRKSPVNLERAMPANGRFGGHIVAGHVDGTGQIAEKKRDDNAVWIRVEAPPEVLRYVVEKGSVTIDGISLTVAAVTAHDFSVSVIPHTAEVTTLGSKKEVSFVLTCFRSLLQAGCHDFIEGILRESVYKWDNDISIEQKSFPLITVGYIGQLGW